PQPVLRSALRRTEGLSLYRRHDEISLRAGGQPERTGEKSAGTHGPGAPVPREADLRNTRCGRSQPPGNGTVSEDGRAQAAAYPVSGGCPCTAGSDGRPG